MEDKKYPIGGFAPGNYMCTCSTCGERFTGDKRAVQCEPCATKIDVLELGQIVENNIDKFAFPSLIEEFAEYFKFNVPLVEKEVSYTEKEVRGLLIRFHNEVPERWEFEKWFNKNKKQ